MKLASSTYPLQGSLEDRLAALRDLGYRNAELVLIGGDKQPALDDWPAAKLQSALSQASLGVVGIYPAPINIRDDESLAFTRQQLRRAIDTAAELGCDRVVFSPLVPRENYDYALLRRELLSAAEFIGDRNVRLAIENHCGWPMSDADDYERLFDDLDDERIGICLDTGHFTGSGVDIPAFIDRWTTRIIHVHLKDHVGNTPVAFGEGETDNATALAKLRALGYTGPVTVEMEAKGDMPTLLRDALAYCRDELGLPR